MFAGEGFGFIRINQSKSKCFQVNQSKSEKGGVFLNRLGFLVLSVLAKNEADNKASAMTAIEMSEVEVLGYKPNTIYKKFIELETKNYVSQGYKEGKAKTFYITNKGKEFLKDEWRLSE